MERIGFIVDVPRRELVVVIEGLLRPTPFVAVTVVAVVVVKIGSCGGSRSGVWL